MLIVRRRQLIRRRRVGWSALAVTVTVVLGLLGCSAAHRPDRDRPRADDAGEPVVGPIPTIRSSAGLRLPVEDFLPTAEQSDRLARAQVALVRACLARFGIAYDVAPIPSGQYGPISLTDRRYGITDLELARGFGYGLGPRDPGRVIRPDKPQLGADGETVLAGQGRSVVNGLAVPDGGCIGEADRGLTDPGPSAAELRRGNHLQFESFAQSRVDSRIETAFFAWSTCMAEAGYRYADPLAAAADPVFIGQLDQHQVDVATTDITCKAATNLIGIWFTVESAYQRRAINADPRAFAAARASIDRRDRLARAADH